MTSFVSCSWPISEGRLNDGELQLHSSPAANQADQLSSSFPSASQSVGTDHIALESAWKRGVLIGFTPDILTDAGELSISFSTPSKRVPRLTSLRAFSLFPSLLAVADLTVLLALFAMRRGKEALLTVQAGKWPSFSPYGLAGQGLSSRSVLGFLGFGRIAQATLQRMLPFGPKKCLYSTRTRKDDVKLSEEMGCEMEWVDRERLARESDVVFVLCNGGEETKGLVGEEFLGRMKKSAVLVNTARVSRLSFCLRLREEVGRADHFRDDAFFSFLFLRSPGNHRRLRSSPQSATRGIHLRCRSGRRGRRA